jgi:hypothetical protein
LFVMKKEVVKPPRGLERDEVLAAAERTRQACNKLASEERRRLREKALAMIYGHDAKTSARRR